MYAIVETGGKQYKVAPGDVIQVERLPVDAGSEVSLGAVLLVADDDGVKVGVPTVDGASVVAQVVAHGRGRKIKGFKYKAKANYRRRYGHRQEFSRLMIQSIQG